jgi:hypothetical protein
VKVGNSPMATGSAPHRLLDVTAWRWPPRQWFHLLGPDSVVGFCWNEHEQCRTAQGRQGHTGVEHGHTADSIPQESGHDAATSCSTPAHGVLWRIDTDAHAVGELDFMRWGIEQARRGWVTKAHVANTRPLAKLHKLLHERR